MALLPDEATAADIPVVIADVGPLDHLDLRLLS